METKSNNSYALEQLYFATLDEGDTRRMVIANIYEEYGVSYIIDTETGNILNPNRVKIIDSLSDGLRKRGLSSLLKRPNGRRITTLLPAELINIQRVIINKSKLDKKEIEEIKNTSRMIVNFVADLLGLNIDINPSTKIHLIAQGDIKNVLVMGTKLEKLKKELVPFIEMGLYERIDSPYELVITNSEAGLDSCVETILKRVGIVVSDTLRSNKFSLKASTDRIMVKGNNESDYSLCYEVKGGKVKKIV